MMKLTKKTIFALSAAILLTCGLLFCGLYLHAHAGASYTPSGALRAPATEHSRVALTGSGYKVNKTQTIPLKKAGALTVNAATSGKTQQKSKKKAPASANKSQPQPQRNYSTYNRRQTTGGTTGNATKPSTQTNSSSPDNNQNSDTNPETNTSKKNNSAGSDTDTSKKNSKAESNTDTTKSKTDSNDQETDKNARSGKAIQITTSIPKDCTTDKKSYEFTVTVTAADGKPISSPVIQIISPENYTKTGDNKFKVDLEVGTNTIIIKATDKETKTSITKKEYVKRTDSNKKYPYIETSLEDKMTTSKSYVDFTLDARDENGAALDDYLYISHNRYPNVYTYHYKSGSYFTKDEWCEIFKNTKNHKFRVNLKHGKNVITIRTDETDNVRLETKRTMYCNSKSTGAVTIGIEANTLSLGKLAPEEKCLIYKHDTVLDIINKYLNDSDFNFELEYWDMYTSIINRISKENITKDAKVPENLINAINANEKYNYEKRSYKKDSISLNDFADGSAWTVSINGQITFGQQIYEYSKAKNNQKITIAFSLTGDGADLDGTLKW